jgi:site-specific DNA-methyltransferase (adenine-specific)
MRLLPAESIDAVVCDPPYELGFMKKSWDSSGIAFDPATWREVLRVLKPGGYLLAFGGTRTYHRLACAVEDAGFEIRDSLIWNYGSGFPKSLNVGNGRGTALKPAFEPVVVARKPPIGTVAANVLKHGTGALNIDASRIGSETLTYKARGMHGLTDQHFEHGDRPYTRGLPNRDDPVTSAIGRWPANVIFTHAPECVRVGTRADTFGGGAKATSGFVTGYERGEGFVGQTVEVPVWACAPGCPVAALDAQSGVSRSAVRPPTGKDDRGVPGFTMRRLDDTARGHSDTGGASRFFTTTEYGEDDDLPGVPFFYNAKASRSEREAGCGELPGKTAVEAVGRDPESAGAKNPRAGAGRGAGAVREACALCGVAVGASERRGREAKPCPGSEDGRHVPEARETGVVIRNIHPTVKPVAVMRWLVRLVTPPGGVVLDPFLGSGTTGVACVNEGFLFIGIEREAEYVDLARARIDHATNNRKAL